MSATIIPFILRRRKPALDLADMAYRLLDKPRGLPRRLEEPEEA